MTIPSSRSLIFEVKSTGCELAFIRLRKTSDFFGRLRTSSEIFGNDRVVFKNPSTPRIKISRLYLRKSWQVYWWEVSALTTAPSLQKKAGLPRNTTDRDTSYADTLKLAEVSFDDHITVLCHLFSRSEKQCGPGWIPRRRHMWVEFVGSLLPSKTYI